MENAADALLIAGMMMIFILALSLSMTSFSKARSTADKIIEYNDREYEYEYVELNKGKNGEISTKRIVGVESIIPAIYKAYKENYKIVFKKGNGDDQFIKLYRRNEKYVSRIDLENDVIGSDDEKERFLKCLLNPSDSDPNVQEDIKKFKKTGFYFDDPECLDGTDGLYKYLSSHTFEESLGIYYQEELTEAETPDANKTQKRVITYTLVG